MNIEIDQQLLRDVPLDKHLELKEYVFMGKRPGKLLYAMLINQFVQAGLLSLQEPKHAFRLSEWALLISYGLPIDCSGDEERVEAWIRMGGVKGVEEHDRLCMEFVATSRMK